MKKKNKSNPPLANTNDKSNPHGQKLANTRAPKIQKKQSISKANLFNQITIPSSNGEEKINLFNVQHKKKKKKSIEEAKGKCILEPSNNNTDHMDVDQAQFKDDIIMEILYRLPVRYLVQFKCVSKSWMALISDPYFVKKHLNHAKNDPHSQKLLFTNFPLLIMHLPCILVLYRPFNLLTSPTSCKHSIHMLWNPSTRESIVLPKPEYPFPGNYCLGLGYDSTTGDYKILKIHSGIHYGSEVPGEILTLKSGSWRSIDKYPRAIWSCLAGMDSDLAFVNDAFHWICMLGNYNEISRTFSLVSFSISNEVYTDIPLPDQILCLKGSMSVGVSVLDGMLCAYSTYEHQRNHTFKLWVLKDYGVNESWNTLFIIDDWRICKVLPKYWFADGEVLFWFDYMLVHDAHSFRTSRGPFGICDAFQNGFAFIESLISPKSLI